jgi:hemerythrin-like domain-containing protein
MCDHCGCRAFPPIAQLTAEHEEILRRAWELAEAEREGRHPVPAAMDDLLRLLEVHVAKEEAGLYPQLIARDRLSPDQLVDLEKEHCDIRAALVGAGFDRRDFYALAAHIEAEEMELFPAAMLGFDDDEWDAMDDAHHRAAEKG